MFLRRHAGQQPWVATLPTEYAVKPKGRDGEFTASENTHKIKILHSEIFEKSTMKAGNALKFHDFLSKIDRIAAEKRNWELKSS